MKTVIALVSIIIAIIAVTMNQAMAQTDQLYHLEQLAQARGANFNATGLEPTIGNYKLFLAAQVAVDEQGNDPSHPVNSTINNPNLANLDLQILSYLCEIDTTYCAGGDSYPLK